jgi:hypothetical protein
LWAHLLHSLQIAFNAGFDTVERFRWGWMERNRCLQRWRTFQR